MKVTTIAATSLLLALSTNAQWLNPRPGNASRSPRGYDSNNWRARTIESDQAALTQGDQANLVASAKAFIDLLAAKDFAKAETNFDDTMKSALPQEKLADTWNSVLAEAGAFKQYNGARTQSSGAYEIVIVTVEFEQTKLDVRVVFDQARRVAGLFFAPTPPEYTSPGYVNTSAFRETEVIVGTEWALPGTLSLPTGAGPFPVVVLVHGSGPNDRDETVGANKPFRDLAGGLASKGIAVLRYEKRTRQHAKKLSSITQFTVKEEVTDDVRAAIALLRQMPAIDKKRIFVLGHSLGGMLIPRIGKNDPDIAGLIVLAGATRPLEDVIPEQLSYIFSLDGAISKEEQAQLDDVRQQAARIKELKPSDNGSSTSFLGVPASYWLDLRGYDPPETARALKQPMLLLQGERDYQVTMEDFRRWRAALGHRRDVVFKSYPGLNHLFAEGSGKSVPAEYGRTGHVAEPVIVDIATWIRSIKR